MTDGLSNRQINSVLKDRRGLLWIGTKYGLNNFDGYTFKSYTKEHNGLLFNYIDRIVEDAGGKIWLIGPVGKNGIASFDPVTKKVADLRRQLNIPSEISFSSIVADRQKKIYLIPEKAGSIYTYTPKTGLIKQSVPHLRRVTFFVPAPENRFILVSNDSTLVETDSNFTVLSSRKFPYKIKMALHGPHKKGMMVWQNTRKPPETFFLAFPFKILPLSESDLPVHDTAKIDFIMDLERDGIMWRQGRLFDRELKLITDFPEMGFKDLSNSLRTVINGSNDEIWIGNNFGLYKITINKNKFHNYFTIPKFNEDNRNSFRGIAVADGVLKCNNEATGLHVRNLKTAMEEFPVPDRDFGGYTCLVKDRSGNLLQGCFYGIKKISADGKKTMSVRNSAKGVRVWSMEEEGNEIFIAGTEEGLMYFDNKKNLFIPFTKYNGFSELKEAIVIGVIKQKGTRNLWICSTEGLYLLSPTDGVVEKYASSQKGKYFLPAENFHHLYEDGSGIFWISTSEGVIRWDRRSNETRLFTRADGLSDNTVYGVLEDAKGYLWMASDYGLMRFNRKSFSVKTFLVENGIANNEFNRISFAKDTDGKMYFGTLNGVTSLDPADFPEDNAPVNAPFIISSFMQFDHDSARMIDKTEDLLRTGEIILEPDHKLFTIDYVLLNYNYTEQNLYAHRIDGVNDDWVYSKEHSLSISSLPSGDHELMIRVKAINSQWSEPIRIMIHVEKPFYLKAWFFIVVIALMVLFVYGFFLYRTRQYRKTQSILKMEVEKQTATILEQSLELQKSLQQKETLLREIHHRVKNNLQVISGLLSLQGGGSQSEELKAIMKDGRNRVKSMALIHQMLYQNENLSQIGFQDYLIQLTKGIAAGFKGSENLVEIKVEAEGISFDVDTAIPLGLIINELVTNSLKYAFEDGQRGVISVFLKREAGNLFRLKVQDNGKGFSEISDEKKNNSLGIKLVKMLCSQLRAEMKFYGGDGTTFEICFNDTWKK